MVTYLMFCKKFKIRNTISNSKTMVSKTLKTWSSTTPEITAEDFAFGPKPDLLWSSLTTQSSTLNNKMKCNKKIFNIRKTLIMISKEHHFSKQSLVLIYLVIQVIRLRVIVHVSIRMTQKLHSSISSARLMVLLT
jgi:hypothetical protein